MTDQSLHLLRTNAVQRLLSRVFPGFFQASTKHDHYIDFGWPASLTFEHFYQMYCRNGLAAAAVDRTVAKTWETNPRVWEVEQKPKETPLEAEVRRAFAKLRLWQKMAEADRRSLVGSYSGLILRLADNKAPDQPVDRVPGGMAGVVELVPAWAGQLTVSTWDTNLASPTYGAPTMYQFNEAAFGEQAQPRQFPVHPDRVIIWSDDGTVNGRSALEPGFNDLIDLEKIKGAGGEGFWKTSRGAPVIEAPQGVTPAQVADGMQVPLSELSAAINDQIDDFQKGFDKGLLLGGMTAKPMTITLPQPEQFFAGPLSSFAASWMIPVKLLVGSQTGERASTEDAAEWAKTCMSRRNNRCLPLIEELIGRFVAWGVLPDRDWTIGWDDLTEASPSDKLARAKTMSDINKQTTPGDDPAFTSAEIREAAGYMTATDLEEENDGEEE